MKKLEAELKEIEEKSDKLQGQKNELLEARNNINARLTQIEVELLRLQGEQRAIERLSKNDTPKSPDKGADV